MYQPYTASFGYQRNNEHSMQVYLLIVSYYFPGTMRAILHYLLSHVGYWTRRMLLAGVKE